MMILKYIGNKKFPLLIQIRFDHDYEVIKNTLPASNESLDDRIASLFVVIKQGVKNEQFRVCLMPQNHVVVQNKTLSQTRT